MMTIGQLRAARALLNLSQNELAELAGISGTSLSAIEREAKAPRAQTLANLQSVLEGRGIEFTEGHGVRLAEHVFDIRIFNKTQQASIEYHNDILATLKAKGGFFLALSYRDTYADEKLRRVQFDYFCKMLKFGFRERIILPENNAECYGPRQVSEYRLLKPELFGQMEVLLYGDKFVINEPSRVVVMHSKTVTDAFRKQFDFYWKMAKPVPAKTPRVFDLDAKRWGS